MLLQIHSSLPSWHVSCAFSSSVSPHFSGSRHKVLGAIDFLLRFGAMCNILITLIRTLCCGFRSRASLLAEILALRHQLTILKRSSKKRPRLGRPDRLLWVWLSRLWPDWRNSLLFVRPETVLAWHRKGFQLYWMWKSRRRRPGRPDTTQEIRDLIRKMCAANATWGAPRIHGELQKLGVEVSQATVAKYMIRRSKPLLKLGARFSKITSKRWYRSISS